MPRLISANDLRVNPVHLDWKRVFAMLTEREAKRCRKLIAAKDEGGVRTIIMHAIGRTGQPLAFFQKDARERITVLSK